MNKIDALLNKGAVIPHPGSVTIADDVDIERIEAKDLILYPQVTVRGARTYIAHGVQLGAEGTSVIENCFIGPDVQLKGGFFSGAVFLRKSSCGMGSHIRQGTILEEGASIAHTVGLKQTILLPFVTLGSLINFCDCLMAGGTDRKNHSEVGSSYIHFNFTPNQDKATPSIMGDVPKGVMLSQAPIFLGGQGGLVGPCQIAYGTVLAAGTICRTDQLIENHLVFGEKAHSGKVPYIPGIYHGLKRIIKNNLVFLGNLYSLRQWYFQVRSRFVGPEIPQPLLDGLKETLQSGIIERITQLKKLSEHLKLTRATDGLRFELPAVWERIELVLEALLAYEGQLEHRESFLKSLDNKIEKIGKSYLSVIQSLDPKDADVGTQWLQSIVSQVVTEVSNCLPSMKNRGLERK